VVQALIEWVEHIGEPLKTATKEMTKAILEGLTTLFSENRRWLLFFGSGTSCALDPRLGMSALSEHLKREIGDAEDWCHVQIKLEAGQTLEQALTDVGLSRDTKHRIQQATGDYIAEIDGELRDKVLLGEECWVGKGIVHSLVRRLPPLNPRLSVVTTNYDMLIEYACTVHDIPYTTGFSGQMIRTWNWEQAMSSLSQCQITLQGKKSILVPLPRVELLKLHGSINLFTKRSDNRHIECDLWCRNPPAGLTRAIAPPGGQKYEQYARIIKETASHASRVEKDAMAFAVIGYGFNDLHLHEGIAGRVQSQNCPLLVLTLDLADDHIDKLRALGKQVWILMASKTPAGDSCGSHTLVYSPYSDNPVVLGGASLWRADCFAEKILGD
jgi:hypothetical protein